MPGSFTLKPIEANLTHNTELIGRMSPYCAFLLGDSTLKGQICKKGGKHPHWKDSTITFPAPSDLEPCLTVKVMNKDRITSDDHIGSFLVDLSEVQSLGHLTRWFPLTFKNKPAGEILLEANFTGDYNNIASNTQITQPITSQVRPLEVIQHSVILSNVNQGPSFNQYDMGQTSHHEVTKTIVHYITPENATREVHATDPRASLHSVGIIEPIVTFKPVVVERLQVETPAISEEVTQGGGPEDLMNKINENEPAHPNSTLFEHHVIILENKDDEVDLEEEMMDDHEDLDIQVPKYSKDYTQHKFTW